VFHSPHPGQRPIQRRLAWPQEVHVKLAGALAIGLTHIKAATRRDYPPIVATYADPARACRRVAAPRRQRTIGTAHVLKPREQVLGRFDPDTP
jgi:hypothetical protein